MALDPDNWILVTGGTGFVGQALVHRLLALGCKVRVATRSANSAQTKDLLQRSDGNSRLQIFECDVASIDSLEPAFEGVRLVFHAAALVNAIASDAVFEQANVGTTRNICELCLKHGVARLVHVSTNDVFGIPGADEVITEATPYRQWNEPYADTKIAAAELLKSYQSKGLVSSLVYPGFIYGPGDRAFLPSLIVQIKSGLMPLWGAKPCELNLIFIDDLVEALLLCAERPEAANQDFLILDAERVAMQDICGSIAAALGLKFKLIQLPLWFAFVLGWFAQLGYRIGLMSRPELSTTIVKSFGYRFRYSNAKARERLGWTPKTSFQAGIRIALEWEAANPLPPA